MRRDSEKIVFVQLVHAPTSVHQCGYANVSFYYFGPEKLCVSPHGEWPPDPDPDPGSGPPTISGSSPPDLTSCPDLPHS